MAGLGRRAMNVARVYISLGLLGDALLPQGTQVLHGRLMEDTHVLELLVSHPDLPPTDDEIAIARATPRFRRRESITFDDWGIE